MKKNILLIILLIVVVAAGWWVYDRQKLAGNNNLAQINPAKNNNAFVVTFENIYSNYLHSQMDPDGLGVDFTVRVIARNKPLPLPVRAHIDIIDADSGRIVTSVVSDGVTSADIRIKAIPINTPTRLYFRSFVVPDSLLPVGPGKYHAILRSFSWEGGSQVVTGFQTNNVVHNRPASPGDMTVQHANAAIAVVRTTTNELSGLKGKFNVRATISGENIRHQGMNGFFEVIDARTGIRVPATDWAFVLGPGPQLQKGQTYTLTFSIAYPAHRLTPGSSYKIVMTGIRFTDIHGHTKTMPLNPTAFTSPTVSYNLK